VRGCWSLLVHVNTLSMIYLVVSSFVICLFVVSRGVCNRGEDAGGPVIAVAHRCQPRPGMAVGKPHLVMVADQGPPRDPQSRIDHTEVPERAVMAATAMQQFPRTV
jgi:hypothetical protein